MTKTTTIPNAPLKNPPPLKSIPRSKEPREKTTTPAAVHPPEPAAEPEGYISVKEAAAFLSIPANTCYKLCLSRTLPSYKAGKLRRLKKSEVAAFMESRRVEALPGR